MNITTREHCSHSLFMLSSANLSKNQQWGGREANAIYDGIVRQSTCNESLLYPLVTIYLYARPSLRSLFIEKRKRLAIHCVRFFYWPVAAPHRVQWTTPFNDQPSLQFSIVHEEGHAALSLGRWHVLVVFRTINYTASCHRD